MKQIIKVSAWLMAAALPCYLALALPADIDQDILNSIFGAGMDSARYGGVGEEWEEIQVTLIPEDGECKPIQKPRQAPKMMELHEELKKVEVLRESGSKKCDYYKATQGFECVPYYQCGDDGTIITDGEGLIDIRFGGESSSPELAVLDSTDLMCPGSLDVCCKNPDFTVKKPAPIVSTPTPGYGNTEDSSEEVEDGGHRGGEDDGDKSDEDEEGYGENADDKSKDGDGGYGGGDGADDKTGDGDGGYGGGDGADGKTGDGGGVYGGDEAEGDIDDAVCTGDCSKTKLPLKFQSRCGRRNLYGLGVRVQNYKDGESQFGEWPHICAILKVQTTSSGYGVYEEVKVFAGGASLIAPGVVLTAAHKVRDFVKEPGQLIVRCGEWDTQTNSEPLPHQDRKVKEVVLHPEFNIKNLANTASLLFLEQDFILAEHIDTICLPDIEEEFVEESECFVKGWGKDKWTDGEYQVVLKEVSLPMVERQECLSSLKKTRLGRNFRLDQSFVCAGGEVGQDACKGDGGGPLVCPMKSNPDRFVQVGIVAWGIGCGDAIPGVYTSVERIGCWIDYTLKCKLGDSYQLRYGTECTPWLQAKQSNPKSANAYKCTVQWTDRERSVDDYSSGGGEAGQSLPEKIQIPAGY